MCAAPSPEKLPMKQIRVPCLFGLAGKKPFHLYVGEPNPENHPLKYQSDWLRRERGGTVPKSVLESMKRLQQIAIRSHVSFEDLCAYAIGQTQTGIIKSGKRPPATLAEAQAQSESAPKLPLQVIHNANWEEHALRQDDERTKLPRLQLVAQNDAEEPVEEWNKPARKPKPGVELEAQRRRVPSEIAELERQPFRHLYDWLRTRPSLGFAEIQSLVMCLLPADAEEEQLLLSTLMLEEVQSVLLPHSFAETLDFIFHYEDLHYSFAVVLDAGAQFLSRSTYGNVLYLYQRPKAELEKLRTALQQRLTYFAANALTDAQRGHAPEGFDLAAFQARTAHWFRLQA